MNHFAEYAQQLSAIMEQHLPPEVASASLPTAAAALLIGVGVCVLGAKLARWFIAVAFAAGGIATGLYVGAQVGAAPPVAALIGGVTFGGVGFVLHRLWVGAFAGIFLATVAFGVLGAELMLPHQASFEEERRAQEAPITSFEPGPVQTSPTDAMEQAVAAGWEQFAEYTKSLLEFAMVREPHLQRYGALWVIGAGALGLMMGIFLCRLTLILFTSAFGVSLIGTGIAMIGPRFDIDLAGLCRDRPEMTGLALAACFLLSVIMQAVLTRDKPAPALAKPKK